MLLSFPIDVVYGGSAFIIPFAFILIVMRTTLIYIKLHIMLIKIVIIYFPQTSKLLHLSFIF
jgi:hypothetical protein